jgi:hypothetical protein
MWRALYWLDRNQLVAMDTFDKTSTAEQVTAGLDLAGQAALVTGAA